MDPKVLKELLGKQPFQPFRLIQTDGKSFDVRHPDLLWVGKREAMVGTASKDEPALFERFSFVDLLHVIRVEPLEAKSKAGKQNGSGKS